MSVILFFNEEGKIGKLNSFYFEPEDGEHPTSAVILLHGYGASGRDLLGLADDWKTKFPSTLFISPDAPYECEASPIGRQWFSLAEYTHQAMRAEIENEWSYLSDYINAVISDFKIPESNIILCGFSQGTMMALYTMMKRDGQCAGILGYSGRLLDYDLLKYTKNKSVPINLIHGSADPVILSMNGITQ